MSQRSFDFVILGSGPSGQKAAIQAAKSGQSVLMVEREKAVGGICVHRGTIPSKTLRETTVIMERFRKRTASVCSVNYPTNLRIDSLLTSVSEVVHGHVDYMSAQLERNQVETIHGRGRFVGPHEIEIQLPGGKTETVRAEHVVIGTGSRPRRPDNVPIDHENVFDSDSFLSMTYLPASLVVLGAGVIASEYASVFQTLGVTVTMIDKYDRPLGFLDPSLTDRFVQSFEEMGGRFIPNDSAKTVEWNGFDAVVTTTENGERIESDKLFCALGRIPTIEGMGLEEIGVELTPRGFIAVNEDCQTSLAHIYAVGDVIGPPALASTAMEQGRRATCHALGIELAQKPEQIPAGIYAIPEMSSVGLTEAAARERHGDILCGYSNFDELARGQIRDDTAGLLKLVTDATGTEILGVHIVGEDATELVHVGQMAMMGGMSVDVFRDNIFNFPTLVEAYRVAAIDIVRQRSGNSGQSERSGEAPAGRKKAA